VLCTSVNDAALHGLPFDYVLRDGDVVSLDFAASVDGWVADSAISIVVGTARAEDLRLIDTTRRALDAGIAAARPGNRIGDISRAIADVAKSEGYTINTDFGGHGVGRTMHGDPHIPNNGRPGRGLPLKPGLVEAIEPRFLESTDRIFTDPDGWTLRSADGSRGAHSEHTIAVTEGDPIVLTERR
jgi:methionyl aminopeptidase